MVVRVIALVLLALLIVRMVLRVALRLVMPARPGKGAGAAQRPGRPGDTTRRPVKQLVPCPVCGTHFEADRGLPRRAGETVVCSEACRAGATAEAAGPASEPQQSRAASGADRHRGA